MKPEKKTDTSSSRCGRERATDYQGGWWLVRKLLLVTEDKNGSMMHSAVDVGCIALLLGNNVSLKELKNSATTSPIVGRLQQSELDKPD
jgi:hypothetical protein